MENDIFKYKYEKYKSKYLELKSLTGGKRFRTGFRTVYIMAEIDENSKLYSDIIKMRREIVRKSIGKLHITLMSFSINLSDSNKDGWKLFTDNKREFVPDLQSTITKAYLEYLSNAKIKIIDYKLKGTENYNYIVLELQPVNNYKIEEFRKIVYSKIIQLLGTENYGKMSNNIFTWKNVREVEGEEFKLISDYKDFFVDTNQAKKGAERNYRDFYDDIKQLVTISIPQYRAPIEHITILTSKDYPLNNNILSCYRNRYPFNNYEINFNKDISNINISFRDEYTNPSVCRSRCNIFISTKIPLIESQPITPPAPSISSKNKFD